MAFCTNRPFFVAVLALGLLGIAFHLIGFVAPGWVVMTFSTHELGAEKAKAMMMQRMINEGMSDEDVMKKKKHGTADEKPRFNKGSNRLERPTGHANSQEGPRPIPEHDNKDKREQFSEHKKEINMERKHLKEMEGKEKDGWKRREIEQRRSKLMHGNHDIDSEVTDVKVWAKQIVGSGVAKKKEIQYGLLFSKFCIVVGIHKETAKPFEVHDLGKDKDEDGSRKCKKISPKTAMMLSNTFESAREKGMMKKHTSTKHIGYASLTEHRVEIAVALALVIIGVTAGAFAFWKPEGPKVAAIVCIVSLLVGVVLISVPAMRFAHYNHHKKYSNERVEVHCPLSVIATGIAAIFLLIAVVVAAVGLYSKTRKTKSTSFYRFTDSEKKSDQLPEKAGFYDNADMKPVEIILSPEKVAVA